jgi:hypothetical protein
LMPNSPFAQNEKGWKAGRRTRKRKEREKAALINCTAC